MEKKNNLLKTINLMYNKVNLKHSLTLVMLCIFGFTFIFISPLQSQINVEKDAEFKPSGNLYGYVFGDYSFKAHSDTLSRGGGNVQYRGPGALSSGNTNLNNQTNAFQIRRMYLGYDYQFAKNFSASVVLANEQTLLPNNQNAIYLKHAYLKWTNVFKNSDLVIGQYQTCTYATPYGTEALWGYRSIERMIIDMHNNDGSTDLGLSLLGKVWTEKNPKDSLRPTFIGYIVQVGNGNGAVPETDIFKKIRVNIYTSLLKQSLTIGVNGDYMVQQLSPYHTNNLTLKAYGCYKTEKFRIGIEAYQQTNKNSDIYKISKGGIVDSTTKSDTTSGVQFGVSLFGAVQILKNTLNFFARFDVFNPNTKWNVNNVYSSVYSGIRGNNLTTSTFYKQNFITTGFDWTPNPRVHIMPNIWYNHNETMMKTTRPGDTGNALPTRIKSDNDLVYRITFYFIFNSSKKIANNGMNY